MLYKTTIPLLAQIVSIVVSDLALATLFDTIHRFGDSVAQGTTKSQMQRIFFCVVNNMVL